MATTPDERPQYNRIERVVEETKKIATANFSRWVTAIAVGLIIGPSTPGVAIGTGLLIYVLGGKR